MIRRISAAKAPTLSFCRDRGLLSAVAYYWSPKNRRLYPVNYYDYEKRRLVCCENTGRDCQLSCVSFCEVTSAVEVMQFETDAEREEWLVEKQGKLEKSQCCDAPLSTTHHPYCMTCGTDQNR